MTRRHLIAVPGGEPVEFDSGPEDHCPSCGAREDGHGNVLHDSECAAAKGLLSQDNLLEENPGPDVANALADAERRRRAEQYVEATLGRPDLSTAPDERRRAELADAYVAGLRQAEARLLDLVRPRLVRLREDLDRLESEIVALTGEG